MFDNHEAMAAHAVALEAEGYAVYFGLNPVLASKTTNTVAPGRATSKADVLYRRLLLVRLRPRKARGRV